MAKKKNAPVLVSNSDHSPSPTVPLALVGLGEPSLVDVELSRIELNPENPARGRGKEDLSELEASIRAHGILQPPIARRVAGRIQVVAGERRVLAAIAAGLQRIQVLLFDGGEMDDRRALEVALVENLHRRDMTPLDEARAYRVLRDRGLLLEDIQAHVGRSLAHVHRRLSLTGLAEEAVLALEAGNLSIGAAEQIARLSCHEAQREVLGELGFDLPAFKKGIVRSRWGGTESVTARGAQRAVHVISRELARAPWDLGDAELVPAAGACLTCPKRSAAQETMFAAGDVSEEDRCMDPACWSTKLKANSARTVAAATAQGATVLSPAESKKLYPNGSTFLQSPKHVDLDSTCDIPGRRGTWRSALAKVLPDLEKAVVLDSEGVVHLVAERKDVMALARASGLVKRAPKAGRTSEDARRANELADARRATALSDAVLDRALTAISRTEGGMRFAPFLPVVLGRALGRMLHDQRRELARRWSRADGWSLPALVGHYIGTTDAIAATAHGTKWEAPTLADRFCPLVEGLVPAQRHDVLQLLLLELSAVNVEYGFADGVWEPLFEPAIALGGEKLPLPVACLAQAAGMTTKDVARIEARLKGEDGAKKSGRGAGKKAPRSAGRKAKKKPARAGRRLRAGSEV